MSQYASLSHQLASFIFCSASHLQFALLIKVEDAFFEAVHLAEHQGFIKHSVVTPQQRHSLPLQDLLSLQNICIRKRKKKLVKKIVFPTHFCHAFLFCGVT